MFGIRSPVKKTKTERDGPSIVRRSIDEIEATMSQTPNTQTNLLETQETRPKSQTTQEKKLINKPKAIYEGADTSPKQAPIYKSRLAEAKACLLKAKLQLNNSRNLKSDIKAEVLSAIERLYGLVKEAEGERTKIVHRVEEREDHTQSVTQTQTQENSQGQEDLTKRLEEHGRLLSEHKDEMKKLQQAMSAQREMYEETRTYASVTARTPSKKPQEPSTMHSVIVTSKHEHETGEQVLEKIKKAINAKEEGVQIDRIRHARDRRVIIGCKNANEIRKIKEKIKETGGTLKAEDIQNKDPLVILYGVLKTNTDDDIIKALKTQNKNLIEEASSKCDNIEIRYRRKARNPHTEHVVAKVPPLIWKRLTEAGAVHIDIQRIRVADQSPLVQCSRCLGYGHGKRFCREEVDVCSHCGGPHLRAECLDWMAEAAPNCINCSKAKIDRRDHSAFSSECPVRRRWDTIARSTVAYC